jgi:hypothetical protein
MPSDMQPWFPKTRSLRNTGNVRSVWLGDNGSFSHAAKADPPFVERAFRKRQRQADPNRHQLAPCCLSDDRGGGLVHVLAWLL